MLHPITERARLFAVYRLRADNAAKYLGICDNSSVLFIDIAYQSASLTTSLSVCPKMKLLESGAWNSTPRVTAIVPTVNVINRSRSTTSETYCQATRFSVQRSSFCSRRSPRSSVSQTRDRVLTNLCSRCPSPQLHSGSVAAEVSWCRILFPVAVTPLPRLSESGRHEAAGNVWRRSLLGLWSAALVCKSSRTMSSSSVFASLFSFRWNSYSTWTVTKFALAT